MSTETELSRTEVDALQEPTLLEFGTSWCGYCQAARPLIDAELARFPALRRIWIEDGKGRALGRSFQVKLWPTLILVDEGTVLGRLVRPTHREEIAALLSISAVRQQPPSSLG